MKKKILAILLSTAIIFTAIALVIPMSAFKAKAAAVTYSRDTTWYDADASTLVIKDIPDFMEFMYQIDAQSTTDDGRALGANGVLAAISWSSGTTVPFEGQTILLENDIVLNPGITFSSSGPSSTDAYCFTRSGQIGFGGIFDGQGHTISGIYISANAGTQGSLFGVAGAATKNPATNVTVKNLQIKNSYITSTSAGVASLFASAAFNANVRIENVYSCMHLNSNTPSDTVSTDDNGDPVYPFAKMGGFCAEVGGKLTIENSVYAGTMSVGSVGASTGRRIIGGLVAMTTAKEIKEVTYRGNLTVSSSAYYGSFSNEKTTYLGKLIGQNTAYCTVTAKNTILGGYMYATSSHMMGNLIGSANIAEAEDESNPPVTITISNVVYTPMKKTDNADVGSITGYGGKCFTGTPTKIAATAITGDKTTSGIGNGLDPYWVSNSDSSGLALPFGLVGTFTAESLTHDFKYHMDSTVNALKSALGDKKSSSDYTASTYAVYSPKYDAALASITKSADLGAIDVATLKANAEAGLVTVASAKTSLLSALGEKKANDNTYTASSYQEYSNAYDEIVTTINAATSETVESISVATLKAEAEAKLVLIEDTDIPEPEGGNSGDGENETPEGGNSENTGVLVPDLEQGETKAPDNESSETFTANKKIGGCGSSVAISALVAVGIVGATLVIKKKKD